MRTCGYCRHPHTNLKKPHIFYCSKCDMSRASGRLPAISLVIAEMQNFQYIMLEGRRIEPSRNCHYCDQVDATIEGYCHSCEKKVMLCAVTQACELRHEERKRSELYTKHDSYSLLQR